MIHGKEARIDQQLYLSLSVHSFSTFCPILLSFYGFEFVFNWISDILITQKGLKSIADEGLKSIADDKKMMMKSLLSQQQNPGVEENMSNLTSASGEASVSSGNIRAESGSIFPHQYFAPNQTQQAVKKKRNLPGNPGLSQLVP